MKPSRGTRLRALEHSGVNRFLGSLEGGLEYGVGENGNRLSGGQKQRVAIAARSSATRPF